MNRWMTLSILGMAITLSLSSMSYGCSAKGTGQEAKTATWKTAVANGSQKGKKRQQKSPNAQANSRGLASEKTMSLQ